jgi:hypothetical protein
MALGVLSALAQLNRTGNSAVSVTGYDDTADSLYFQPPLTTVAQNFDLLGNGGGAADPADGGAAGADPRTASHPADRPSVNLAS